MRSIKTTMSKTLCVLGVGLLAGMIIAGEVTAESKAPAKKDTDRGRYLVIIAGCNDCHTAGYADAAGKIPEKDWLTGDKTGWWGPWGTTYAQNLRLYMQKFSEEQWLTIARTIEFRPPMPWYIFREMPDQDLKAIYRFIKNLGPAGEPAPAFLPPAQEPPQPYILFPAAP